MIYGAFKEKITQNTANIYVFEEQQVPIFFTANYSMQTKIILESSIFASYF